MQTVEEFLDELTPTLKMQLQGLLPAGELDIYDKDADAINRLAVRGLITEASAARAKKRLIRIIEKAAGVKC